LVIDDNYCNSNALLIEGRWKCREWKMPGNMTAAATERLVKWHYNNDCG